MNRCLFKNLLVSFVMLMLVVMITQCSGKKSEEGKLMFGDKASVDYAMKLWDVMEKGKYVGKNARKEQIYVGKEPHGAILELFEGKVVVNGYTGHLIVKNNYGGKGLTVKMVEKDRKKYLKAITTMFQREDGYDKATNNWFWAKYLADGSLDANPKGLKLAGLVAKKGEKILDKGCLGCHVKAPGNDFIFREK